MCSTVPPITDWRKWVCCLLGRSKVVKVVASSWQSIPPLCRLGVRITESKKCILYYIGCLNLFCSPFYFKLTFIFVPQKLIHSHLTYPKKSSSVAQTCCWSFFTTSMNLCSAHLPWQGYIEHMQSSAHLHTISTFSSVLKSQNRSRCLKASKSHLSEFNKQYQCAMIQGLV